MSIRLRFVFAFVASTMVLVGSTRVHAQDTTDMPSNVEIRDTLSADTLRWSVTPYIGAFLINEDELAAVGMELDSPVVLFGGRIGYRFHPNWTVEGSYGYASLTAQADSARTAGTAPLQEVDGSLHVYNAAFNYMAPRDARARVLLTAGAGGMRYSYDPFIRRNPADERAELVDTSWANEFVLLFGLGFEVDAGERVAFRFDARDHLQFCNAEDEPINETDDFSHCPLEGAVLSNLEFSGGLTVRF